MALLRPQPFPAAVCLPELPARLILRPLPRTALKLTGNRPHPQHHRGSHCCSSSTERYFPSSGFAGICGSALWIALDACSDAAQHTHQTDGCVLYCSACLGAVGRVRWRRFGPGNNATSHTWREPSSHRDAQSQPDSNSVAAHFARDLQLQCDRNLSHGHTYNFSYRCCAMRK